MTVALVSLFFDQILMHFRQLGIRNPSISELINKLN